MLAPVRKRLPAETSATQSERTACAFCQIVGGATAAHVVFEDAISVGFLDNRPLFPGHCLIVTKQHFATLSDIPSELVGPLFLNARTLAAAVQRAMDADGTFVAMNNIVSQSVPHFHIHVVPRKRGDGLRGFFWPRHKLAEEEAASVQAAIVAAVRDER